MSAADIESAPLLGKPQPEGKGVAEQLAEVYPKLITEFIGTFFLVLTVHLTVSSPNQLFAGLAIGTVLAVMIFMGGHVSGGHYNPAVTLGVKIATDDISYLDAFLYVLAQVLGGFTAAGCGYALNGQHVSPAPGLATSVSQAIGGEILFTFALVYVVLSVCRNGNPNGPYAIGMTVFCGATAVGHISGAVFNPAVATGLTLVALLKGGHATHLWLYWVAQITGGSLAALVFYVTNPPSKKEGL